MGEHTGTSAWRAFWSRGGLWRALLVSVGYLALYLGAGQLIGLLFGNRVDDDNVFSGFASVFVALTSSLIIGALLLAAFVASVNWFGPLFAAQPAARRTWMWIAPITIVATITLRFLGIPYHDFGASVVILTVLTGLLVGFVEELLCRGIVIKMLRDAGHNEWIVMVVSSLIFALLHTVNLLSGMSLVTVAVTVVFTLGFGVCMYLCLRATGNLIWAMLIHGLYDPTLFLATGGVDTVDQTCSQNTFLALAAPANIVFILIGVLGLILVRGQTPRGTNTSRP